ncbi:MULTISPECIES: hypothetical protein [unclassified Micromonospora]|uniref:hypothetical protein n=1 Tax=unclassified Micromonospora TaxID=2617518 RepID=UPI0036260F53
MGHRLGVTCVDRVTWNSHRVPSVAHAQDRETALLPARALSTVGAVRCGKQRVKVLPLDDAAPR